jgi:hypothetical protein
MLEQGGPVVTVQSIRIGVERFGFVPSSMHQFLVRIGKEARRLSTAEFESVSCDFKTATSC